MHLLKAIVCASTMLFVTSASAGDWRPLRCDFGLYGSPFATLDFEYNDSGGVSEAVQVTHYGNVHWESLSPEPRGEGILVHATISKESEENCLDLVVRIDFSATLTNPRVPPAVRTMQGSCAEPIE